MRASHTRKVRQHANEEIWRRLRNIYGKQSEIKIIYTYKRDVKEKKTLGGGMEV